MSVTPQLVTFSMVVPAVQKAPTIIQPVKFGGVPAPAGGGNVRPTEGQTWPR